MCGIFGCVTSRDARVALMTYWGLRDLEYRGYDSWGIAAATADGFFVTKSVGKISEANEANLKDILGRRALGHSRWATHGGVTQANAHPHLSKNGHIAVVHNGIIENHELLREELVREFGVAPDELFRSETDTEVVPHLIELEMKRGKRFEDAFVEAARRLEGRYAIVAMHRDEPYLLAVRRGSPLAVGRSSEGYFLASDVPAFLDYTREVVFPGDEEYVRIDGSFMMRSLLTRKKIPERWSEVSWDKTSAEKNGFSHYMLKEIFEQPDAIDQAVRQDDGKMTKAITMLRGADRVFLVGSGTAGKVAKLGEILFLREGFPAQALVGSEHQQFDRLLTRKSVILAVSQSGETADVLEFLELAKKRGAKVISVLNVVGSSVDRLSDISFLLGAGPEIAVASTKAATAQMAVLFLLAAALGKHVPETKHDLRQAVRKLKGWLTPDLSARMKKIAESMKDRSDCYLIGRGTHAPIAMEGAIKIQEVSYIHAEGFPGGELKHGPIALVGKGTPVVALVPSDETMRDMESNAMELRARGAWVVGVAPKPHQAFDEWVEIPDLGALSPLASVIPLQLLAYHLAVLRGNDPDKPRNLAKSVTVK